jgi:single-stranded-DNA-specific exonuclease
VLLREFFDGIGYPVDVYVPHRHNEGYGVHIHAIDALKAKGVTLIITVDAGIETQFVFEKKLKEEGRKY